MNIWESRDQVTFQRCGFITRVNFGLMQDVPDSEATGIARDTDNYAR